MLTTKAANEQRRRIRALGNKWQKRLALNHWRVRHHYHHASSDMPTGQEDAHSVTYASWNYLDADIHWNLENLADLEDDYLEEIFVHELMHMHLAGFPHNKQLDHIHERTATELALSFVFLDKARKK